MSWGACWGRRQGAEANFGCVEQLLHYQVSVETRGSATMYLHLEHTRTAGWADAEGGFQIP